MKKTLALLLTLAVTLASLVPFAFAIEDEGDPLPVGSVAEFMAMDPNGTYYLTADLTLTETYTGTFAGTLDGACHTLTISAPVFDSVKGSVSNLTLVGSVASSSGDLGALACTGDGVTITNVTNKATVTSPTDGSARVGGIIGYIEKTGNKSVFTRCTNTGDVAGYCPGGILGKAESQQVITLTGCVNLANVTGGDCTGGILGWAWSDFEVIDCVNGSEGCDFVVTGVSDGAGGIVGYVSASTDGLAQGCVNYAEMKGNSMAAGGIIARAGNNCEITFRNCTNYGFISNKSDLDKSYGCGGMGGELGGNMFFYDCTNYGDIECPRYNAGGMIGAILGDHGDGVFERCQNYGNVTIAINKNHAGGMVGSVNYGVASFESCVNYGTIHAVRFSGGLSGTLGTSDFDGTNSAKNCLNFGEIISDTDTAGGIFAYLAGHNAAVCANCYNAGNVTGGSEASGILGYINGKEVSVVNCVNIGTIKMNGTTAYAIFYNNNADPSPEIKDNLALAGCADQYAYDAKAGVELKGDFTAEDVASGKVAYVFNQAAGKDLLYQTIGTDAAPVADPSHDVVTGGDEPAIVYGDVDGDGEVIMKDLALIRAYIANYDAITKESPVEVAAGVDVNGDGSVTTMDLMLLRAYIANFDADTGVSAVVLGPQA